MWLLRRVAGLAPHAMPLGGVIAAVVTVEDFADRSPRILADGAALSLGGPLLRWFAAPHLSHVLEKGFRSEARIAALSGAHFQTCASPACQVPRRHLRCASRSSPLGSAGLCAARLGHGQAVVPLPQPGPGVCVPLAWRGGLLRVARQADPIGHSGKHRSSNCSFVTIVTMVTCVMMRSSVSDSQSNSDLAKRLGCCRTTSAFRRCRSGRRPSAALIGVPDGAIAKEV